MQNRNYHQCLVCKFMHLEQFRCKLLFSFDFCSSDNLRNLSVLINIDVSDTNFRSRNKLKQHQLLLDSAIPNMCSKLCCSIHFHYNISETVETSKNKLVMPKWKGWKHFGLNSTETWCVGQVLNVVHFHVLGMLYSSPVLKQYIYQPIDTLATVMQGHGTGLWQMSLAQNWILLSTIHAYLASVLFNESSLHAFGFCQCCSFH